MDEIKYYTDLVSKISSYKELRKLDTMKYKRSYCWIVKYCKPNWMTIDEYHNKVLLDKKERDAERVVEIGKLPYVKQIISSEHKPKNPLIIQFECTNGHILRRSYRIAIKQTECSICSYKNKLAGNRDIKKIELQSKLKKKKLDRFIKYSPRVDTIKKFVSKEENYIKYNNWRETPIHKEYTWYNSNNGIEFRDINLTYKLDWIGYYIYRTSHSCPDKPKLDGYSICNKCREHKIETYFIGNQCKDCAKEYRREFSLPTEKLRMREEYKNNPVKKLDVLLRVYIYGALKGKQKNRKTLDILGISIDEFRNYIESKFENWMNWDNHGNGEGKWALQHIVPRDFATNEDEIYLLNYHKNLMPMCSVENGILQNRMLKNQFNEWHTTNKQIQKIIKRNENKLIS